MKAILKFALLFILCSACSKSFKNATVVKDCTGTYIRISNIDYLVCNENLLNNYQDNTVVNINYKSINTCPALDGNIVCELYHPYKSIVKIQTIK